MVHLSKIYVILNKFIVKTDKYNLYQREGLLWKTPRKSTGTPWPSWHSPRFWGFGNVLNGFVYFNGLQVIFSWILMFALYFVPYALMVGELGSAFKQSGGGVSSWIHETIGPKCAYYAGWTYWACHVTLHRK